VCATRLGSSGESCSSSDAAGTVLAERQQLVKQLLRQQLLQQHNPAGPKPHPPTLPAVYLLSTLPTPWYTSTTLGSSSAGTNSWPSLCGAEEGGKAGRAGGVRRSRKQGRLR
jgi:hypothetical protein